MISAFDVQVGKIIILSEDLGDYDSSILPYWASNSTPSKKPNHVVIPKGTRCKVLSMESYLALTYPPIHVEDVITVQDAAVNTICVVSRYLYDSEGNIISTHYESPKVTILSENGNKVETTLANLVKIAEAITEDNSASKVLYGNK